MITLNRKQKAAFVSGEMNVKDLGQELLSTYPIVEIAESLAELLTIAPVMDEKPIPLTQEDYNRVMAMFRVRGFDAAGETIKRGRPSKKLEGDKIED